jgi:hypothetical protein
MPAVGRKVQKKLSSKYACDVGPRVHQRKAAIATTGMGSGSR